MIGEERLKFPPDHIEADNRLSWFLGRLGKAYGDSAFYVHLKRNDLDTAQSFINRYDRGIINAYRGTILARHRLPNPGPLDVCLDYCDTVNSNIEVFLSDKTKKTNVSLENAKEDFEIFWDLIGAKGDLRAALCEWDKIYNASGTHHGFVPRRNAKRPIPVRLVRKVSRAIRTFRPSQDA